MGYNSNISAMNQSLGIKQFGLTSGLAYYSKTGLYADVAAYWSKQFVPPLYLAVFSGGYLKAVSRKYLFNVEYSYFLYPTNNGQDVSVPYTHSLSTTSQYDLKPFTFKLDYFYYFGSQSAHRILPGISLMLEKKEWGNIERFSIYPTFTVLFGTESTQEFNSIPLTAQQIQDRLKTGGALYQIETVTVFGLMNYSFSLPISVRTKKWNFQLNYTYNVPRSLPNEELGLTNTGYISASIGRYIVFK